MISEKPPYSTLEWVEPGWMDHFTLLIPSIKGREGVYNTSLERKDMSLFIQTMTGSNVTLRVDRTRLLRLLLDAAAIK